MKRTLKQIICDACALLRKDIKQAKWVIIFIIAYFAFMKNFLYSTCPSVLLSGYPCPACGMTRAAICLLRLDFRGAFSIHPFIYAVAAYATAFAINRYILQRKMGKFLKLALAGLMAGMIIYYIWRMLMYFPGEPPMSYYSRNLLSIALGLLTHE